MKTDSLKHIAAIIAVAEHKSLTLAAQALDCSKAHLSKQIKKLEAHYRVQLFHRTTRQLRLTEVGEAFVQECQQALKLVEHAELQLQEKQEVISGTIRITSVGGIFGEQYVAPATLAFMAEYPEVAIELDFSSKHHDLLNSGFDLAVRMGPLENSTLVAKHLCWYKPTLVASHSYIKEYGSPQHPEELAHHKIISGSLTEWQFRKDKETLEYKVQPKLSCSNGHVMMAACEAGLGLARLPSLYVDERIQSGTLIPIMADWHQHKNPCHAVFPPGRYRLQRVKLFADFLEKFISEKTITG